MHMYVVSFLFFMLILVENPLNFSYCVCHVVSFLLLAIWIKPPSSIIATLYFVEQRPIPVRSVL